MRSKIIFACLLIAGVVVLSDSAKALDQPTLQVHIPALLELGAAGKKPHTMRLGGADRQALIVHLNAQDVRHVLLQPDDLKDAVLSVKVTDAIPADARLVLYKLTRETPQTTAVASDYYASTPIADTAIPVKGGVVTLHGSLRDVLNQAIQSPADDHGLLLTVQSPQGKTPEVTLLVSPAVIPAEGEHFSSLSITMTEYPKASLFPQTLRPVENVYTKVVDGHLYYNSERLRLWGVCRHFWGGPAVLDRLGNMGVNAIRLWGPRNAYDSASGRIGAMTGDEGSLENSDSLATFDKFFADAKQHGLFIWMAGLHYDPMGIMHKGTLNGLDPLTADDSFLVKQFGAGEDWNAWKAAISKLGHEGTGRVPHLISEFMYFDPRLKEIYHRHLLDLLNHVNPYTKKKYAEDEAIAVWELNNEEGFVKTTLEYGVHDWPEYYKNELQSQWNQWLVKRYGNVAALGQAWGDLPAGESLDGKSIKFAPLFKDRTTYPAARASDLVRFCCEVTNGFNKEMHDTIRAQAPAGVGAAVVPVVFDTQSLPSAQWLSTDALGDAVSFGTYEFTYHSSLTIPPGLYIMENQSVQGKPTLIYENNALRPDPFRAEYPLRVAALAGWQDWDGVFFHYWKGMGAESDEGYLAAPLDNPGHGYLDGGVYPDEDPAFCASLAMAGRAFRSGAIAPAQKPAVHTVSDNQLYGYDGFAGLNMRHDTFTRGAVAAFNANKPDAVEPLPEADHVTSGAVQCGSQITYDWPNGRLIIDTPTMKAYVGQPHGAYRYSDGIAVDGFSTPFVAFSVVSDDGKPLAGANASHRFLVTAKFDSQNTGFHLDTSSYRGGESVGWDQKWGEAFAANIRDRGHAPAITDAVSYRLSFPTQLIGQVENYDFAFRQATKHAIEGNQIRQDRSDAFLSVVTIDSRGESATTPQSDTPRDADAQAPLARNPAELPDPNTASLLMPLPRIGWGEGYDSVQEYLRESSMLYASISKEATDAANQKDIKLTDGDAILSIPANLELSFADHGLHKITATFSKPVTIEQMQKRYGKVLGEPKNAGDDASWTQRTANAELTVTWKQKPGQTTIVFEIARGF